MLTATARGGGTGDTASVLPGSPHRWWQVPSHRFRLPGLVTVQLGKPTSSPRDAALSLPKAIPSEIPLAGTPGPALQLPLSTQEATRGHDRAWWEPSTGTRQGDFPPTESRLNAHLQSNQA